MRIVSGKSTLRATIRFTWPELRKMAWCWTRDSIWISTLRSAQARPVGLESRSNSCVWKCLHSRHKSIRGERMANENQSTAVIETASLGRLLRGFLISYLLTAVSLGLVGYLWGRVGFDLLIVGMGWPHVIFGFLFNLGKVAEGDRGYRVALASLLLVTLAIGFVNSLRPLTTIIYLYFTFHAFLDDIFIYHQRRTGYRFFGRVFDRNGLGILLGATIVALIGQLPVHGPNGELQLYLGLCAVAGLLSGMAGLFWPKQWD